ncbi:MAG TPA: response regulator transcription factor [Candidatus Aminicenantes bacterium]|nr:response regulator transcription factor [Candidatus Aminicenantes bacterium]
MPLILIVEDDATIREGVADALRFHGYGVLAVGEGKPGLAAALREPVDLAILDLMLPDIDGLEICRRLKDTRPATAVILLTARGLESDKLLGFETGADDYLTKPFSLKELLARVRAVLKRGAPAEPPAAVAIGSAHVDFTRFIVVRDGAELAMTAKECAILRLFVSAPGRVIGRDAIIEAVWKGEYEPTTRTVDNFILKLRQKIEEDPAAPRHLLTVHGAGYRLVP